MTNRRYLLVCTNQKKEGKCCALFDAEAMLHYLRESIKQHKALMPDNIVVKAVKTSCLGRCADGPNILVMPDNIWYTFASKSDMDEIVHTHLIGGKVVARLVNPDTGVLPVSTQPPEVSL